MIRQRDTSKKVESLKKEDAQTKRKPNYRDRETLSEYR